MQRKSHRHADGRGAKPHDGGYTIPELLITVMLTGLIVAVVSSVITLTIRQADTNAGRLNVARAEESINFWVPADLASTDVAAPGAVDTSPSATPCTVGNCAGIDLSDGTNVLQLSWHVDSVITTVGYQYRQVDGSWVVQRVECTGADRCSVSTVLSDAIAPTTPFVPGSESPTWAVETAVDASDPDAAGRVQVRFKIDGGGDSPGRGGGINEVVLQGGGERGRTLAAATFQPPTIPPAQSRCGGRITLIVDTSGSIGEDAMDDVVKPGVRDFIDAFAGTPAKLRVVEFDDRSSTLGSTDWHHYVDATNSGDMQNLRNAAGNLVSDNATNWEDAFFRTFYEADGSVTSTRPKRVIFFTDGIPIVNRHFTPATTYSSTNAAPTDDDTFNAPYQSPWSTVRDTSDGSFSQESFDRADNILRDFAFTELIVVGVGPGLTVPQDWTQNRAAYDNPKAPLGKKVEKTGQEILAELFRKRDETVGAVLATQSGGEYTNVDAANLYLASDFSPVSFSAAMKATALKDCGGTVTVGAKHADGTDVPIQIEFNDVAVRDASGSDIGATPRFVNNFGNFAFDVADSTFVDVDIAVARSVNLTTLYQSGSWTCQAGAEPRTVTSVDSLGDGFDTLTVRVKPNEALACTFTVATT